MDATEVLQAIDATRAETRHRAEREISAVEARRDAELGKLDRAERALVGGSGKAATKDPPKPTLAKSRPRPKGRVRRKHLSPASPKELAARCEKVARLIEESKSPPSFAEIVRALGLTGHKTRAAILILRKEDRIRQEGTGSGTRYVLAHPGVGRLSKQPPTQGTADERIIAVLEDRHRASREELAQALREPLDRVVDACGRLQREERIRMERYNDKPVYMLAVRV
jgi:hypothetical protein